MKENNIQNIIYKYDDSSDILGIKVNRKFEYGQTIEMDEGLLLDFDVDNVPVSLEVLDASKIFNISKKGLENIVFFKMEVCVEDRLISLNAAICVLMDDIENTKSIEFFTANNNNIPNIVDKWALV